MEEAMKRILLLLFPMIMMSYDEKALHQAHEYSTCLNTPPKIRLIDPCGYLNDFSYADLSDAPLEKLNLMFGRFNHANLQRAQLKDSDLRYSELSGANLTGAQNLPLENLFGAHVDNRTILPNRTQIENLEMADSHGLLYYGPIFKPLRLRKRRYVVHSKRDMLYHTPLGIITAQELRKHPKIKVLGTIPQPTKRTLPYPPKKRWVPKEKL